MAKSSQEVRTHMLALRDSLIKNLEVIRAAIDKDADKMNKYFSDHGDFRYRPVTKADLVTKEPIEWGSPTEITIEPLATQMRTTIKSLIDSIRVIEAEILPEDNPEGQDTGQSDREALKAREALRESFKSVASTTAALPSPTDDTPIERTPKEKSPQVLPKPADKSDRGSPTPQPPSQSDTPKPWRQTTPRAMETKPASPVEDPKPVEEPKSVEAKPVLGLSPEMRAKLGLSGTGLGESGSGVSRMERMRQKYKNDSDDEEEG